MADHTHDLVPCPLCFGKFGQHSWGLCPARCKNCDGFGHMLGSNHPIGHIDAHPYPHVFLDVLKVFAKNGWTAYRVPSHSCYDVVPSIRWRISFA